MERILVLEGLFAKRPLYPSFHWSLSRLQGERARKRFASGFSQDRRTTLKRSPGAPEMRPKQPQELSVAVRMAFSELLLWSGRAKYVGPSSASC